MIYRMQLADSVDEMTFDLLEVPIEDKDIEGTADNTTIDGNVFTDYLWLKKQFVQKWSLMCEDDYTQLRGFYTRQWDNAEVPAYKLFVGENRSETLTASGSSFQIQNGTQYDAPLTLTEITGNATQTTYSGKNLWGTTLYQDGAFINATGTVLANSDACIFECETIVQGSTYTLSGTPNATSNLRIHAYNNGVWQEQITWQQISANSPFSITFTIPQNTTSIRWSGYIKAVSDAQLELGSTATAYEPYVGGTASPNPDYPQAVNTVAGEQTITISDSTNTQSHTIDLGSIELAKIDTYQDRIYKDSGKWYVEKQVGKLNMADITGWSYSSSGALYSMSFTTAHNAKVDTTLSNIFIHDWTAWAGVGKFGITAGGNLWIMTGDASVVVSNVNTWLSGKNAIMYYILATPTTTEITDSTLLAQLNFIANLYGGTNNIMLVGTGAQGEIGVEYTLTYEKEQVIIPETPVRLNLTDGGVINPCGCRQNVQLTMRETIQ